MQPRWILANVSGGISGVWSGAATMLLLFEGASQLLQFEDCSGTPCGPGVEPSLVVSVVAGSALGGVIGYIVRQRIAQRKSTKRGFLGFALAGAVSWPVVGAVTVALGFLLSWWIDIDADAMLYFVIALSLAIPGAFFGLLLALFRRDRLSED
jgi:hypothetical protein